MKFVKGLGYKPNWHFCYKQLSIPSAVVSSRLVGSLPETKNVQLVFFFYYYRHSFFIYQALRELCRLDFHCAALFHVHTWFRLLFRHYDLATADKCHF